MCQFSFLIFAFEIVKFVGKKEKICQKWGTICTHGNTDKLPKQSITTSDINVVNAENNSQIAAYARAYLGN